MTKSPTKSAVIAASPTVIPPPTSVFKISLDLLILQLSNFNIFKIREYGEWTIQVKVFLTPDKLVATSETLLLASLSAELDLHLPLSFDVLTFGDIDNLIHHPLVVNFNEIEYIVKDAKKKTAPEEKVELIGQCFIDLLPFVTGETLVSKTLPIFPPSVDADSCTTFLPENAAVRLQVKSENGEPVIPKDYADSFNILRFRIDGCYSMPTAWLPTTPHTGSHSLPTPTFTISTFLPTTVQHERYLILSNKVLQEDLSKEKFHHEGLIHWPVNPLFFAKAVHMMEAPHQNGLGSGLNHTNKKKTEEGRGSGVIGQPSTVVRTEFRCVLAKDAEEAFKTKAVAAKVWPVEVFSVTVPEKHTSTTKKKNAEVQNTAAEEAMITKHGVAFLDLSPLLFPGAKHTEGRSPLLPYDVRSFTEKTGRKSVAQELFATPTAPSALPEFDKPTILSTSKQKPIDAHPSNISLRRSMAPSSATSHETPISPTASWREDVDQHLFITSQSYMSASITLLKPLVPKKRIEKPEITVENIQSIHPKTLFPADNGLRAMQELRKEISSTCRLIYSLCEKESRKHTDWAVVDSNVEAALHKAGETCYLRTHLKDFIVRIVRDRFYRTKSLDKEDPEQYNDFLSELYCDLVREISHSLTFHEEEKAKHPMKNKESQALHLRMLAIEAEIEEKLPKAEHYLLLRIHKSTEAGKTSDEVAQYWVELGQFQLKHRKLREAVESFAESMKYDEQNVERMLLIGYALFEEKKTDDALPFFEAAAVLSNSPIAYTALGLFYENLSVDSTGAIELIKERVYYQANFLLGLPAERLKVYEKKIKDAESLMKGEVPSNLPRKTASLEKSQKILKDLLRPFCPAKKSSSVKQETIRKNNGLFQPWKTLEYFDKKRRRKTFIKGGLLDNIFYVSLPAFASLGLYRFATKCTAKLNGVCDVTSPTLWKAAMSSWISRKNFAEVRELMNELDKSDNGKNTRYLVMKGHFSCRQKEYSQARECYDEALNQDVHSTEMYEVYCRYGLTTKEQKDWKKSKEMFHLAAKLHGTALNWLGCGVASFHLEDFVNAEVALCQSNNLDNTVPETWAYLAMVYYRSCQMSKAEKCLATALQCGLRECNEELMHEARTYIYSNKNKNW
ncbi:hypothetical protein RvY_00078 [Ramazzottius varieornatus]|uniref:Cilia- and flagella-associated protein 70 n=1 Tax=Ramazzottius varieornatus TaxID=947166 RepID=A0A1D1UCE9_RAMVA|nr:hypothetical protein RvY_00078 [Ramazzottius varieornatus]